MKSFTRREFYDLVWSKPMTELAKEFGLSDVALHKTCKRHRIPTPGLGYWNKVAAGKPVVKKSFHEISEGSLNRVVVGESFHEKLPEPVKKARKLAQERVQQGSVATASEAADHPAVARLRQKLQTGRAMEYTTVHANGPQYFDVNVAPTSLDRAFNVLNVIAKEAEANGHKLQSDKNHLAINVEGEVVSFSIVEKTDKVPHVQTDAETAALAKWQKTYDLKVKREGWAMTYDKLQIPEHDLKPNGLLVLELDVKDTYLRGFRRKFSDGKGQALEKLIPQIMIGIATCAAAAKERREYLECRDREYEEEKQRRRMKERRENLEKKRIEYLNKHMTNLHRAAEIRAFAAAVESRTNDIDNGADKILTMNWVKWAREYADEIDPTCSFLPILLVESDFREWEL